MPDFSAAIGLLRKPIEDIYVSSSGAIKEKIAIIRTAARMRSLHKKLWESQRVKTIWHTERPLSLTSFFYPVRVTTQGSSPNMGTRLTSLDDLPNNHNIIFGTVGQGKSILVRYLLGREIRSGTRIPVLFELRNVNGSKLIDQLAERFSAILGIPNNVDLFSIFAEKGKISFLLDGFDEIDSDNIQKTTTEIEDLSFKYPECRILLSSRPDTECKNLTQFYTNTICPLSPEDLFPFYKKITKDEDFTNRLVAAIATTPTKIRELVKTPLLATLLAISYRAAQKIPLDFAEFYDELFQVLLIRHDSSKLGWRRQRKTKLNDREIQQIFEAFSFASRKRQSTNFDKETAYQLASDSIKECQLQSDTMDFLDDIRKITCLLLEDGKKLSFVHASVQEFFAARYIKTRTQPVAEKYYAQLLSGKWLNWLEEINFLRQIDTHRATKYFIIPDIDRTVKAFLNSSGSVAKETVDRYLTQLSVARSTTTRDGKETTRYAVEIRLTIMTYHYSLLNKRIYDLLFGPTAPGEKLWGVGFNQDPSCINRTYLQIALDKGGTCYARASELVTIGINALIRERIGMIKTVEDGEKSTAFMDL